MLKVFKIHSLKSKNLIRNPLNSDMLTRFVFSVLGRIFTSFRCESGCSDYLSGSACGYCSIVRLFGNLGLKTDSKQFLTSYF